MPKILKNFIAFLDFAHIVCLVYEPSLVSDQNCIESFHLIVQLFELEKSNSKKREDYFLELESSFAIHINLIIQFAIDLECVTVKQSLFFGLLLLCPFVEMYRRLVARLINAWTRSDVVQHIKKS